MKKQKSGFEYLNQLLKPEPPQKGNCVFYSLSLMLSVANQVLHDDCQEKKGKQFCNTLIRHQKRKVRLRQH